MMGKYPYQTLPLVMYCSNVMLVNLTGFIMLFYLRKNRRLASEKFTDQVFRSQLRTYVGVNGLYVICLALAFPAPVFSTYLLAGLALFLVLRSVFQLGIGRCVIM